MLYNERTRVRGTNLSTFLMNLGNAFLNEY